MSNFIDYAFCFYDVLENEAHCVMECPLYNFIEDKFQSLFKNVVFKSLMYFSQLDNQVNIGHLYDKGYQTPPL